MKNSRISKVIPLFLLLLVFVYSGAYVSTRLWGGKAEKILSPGELIIQENMTIREFGKINSIPNQVLKKAFNLKNKQDLEKTVREVNESKKQIQEKITKNLALYSEQQSKNWQKIFIKFILWFLFLSIVFILMRKSLITPVLRKVIYFTALVIFGIIFGSDPNPMGTVKDAIVLFSASKAIFPPRLIALTLFLLLVLVANKFICSWGCQIGTLQDLIFRMNRNRKDNNGIIKQYKLPFMLMNTIRSIFFIMFTGIAFVWAFDIVEIIDPFKFYNPPVLTAAGIIFILAILVLSLFIYRPWCHFFCPFGLVGWFIEKISIFKIMVNYETCIACNACAKACPSNVMDAILRRKNIIPDCFSCSTCIDICPTDSITFNKGKRSLPPGNKFDN